MFLEGQLVGVSSLQHHMGSRGLAPCQAWQQAPLLEMRSYCVATLAWHWLCSPDCSWSLGDHHLRVHLLSCLETSCEKKHCFFRLEKTTTRHCLLFWDSVSSHYIALASLELTEICLPLPFLRAGINSMCHCGWSFCTFFVDKECFCSIAIFPTFLIDAVLKVYFFLSKFEHQSLYFM